MENIKNKLVNKFELAKDSLTKNIKSGVTNVANFMSKFNFIEKNKQKDKEKTKENKNKLEALYQQSTTDNNNLTRQQEIAHLNRSLQKTPQENTGKANFDTINAQLQTQIARQTKQEMINNVDTDPNFIKYKPEIDILETTISETIAKHPDIRSYSEIERLGVEAHLNFEVKKIVNNLAKQEYIDKKGVLNMDSLEYLNRRIDANIELQLKKIYGQKIVSIFDKPLKDYIRRRDYTHKENGTSKSNISSNNLESTLDTVKLYNRLKEIMDFYVDSDGEIEVRPRSYSKQVFNHLTLNRVQALIREYRSEEAKKRRNNFIILFITL
jgi:hypothetical protein